MRTKQNMVICFGIVLALMIVVIGTASASTLTVNNSTGPVADFTSIQAAVDAAVDGDTILVYPGLYVENVNVYHKANIIITSELGNVDNTIVQAESSNDDVFNVIADNVTINGFNVKGAIDMYRQGIRLSDSNECTISNNVVTGNYYGILLHDTNDSTVIDNIVSGNTNVGIYLFSTHDNTLSNNDASNNREGILLHDTNDSTVIDNIVSENSQNGIILASSNSNTLRDNVVSGNNLRGIYLGPSTNLGPSNDNLIYNNFFNNSNNVDFLGTNVGNSWNVTQTLGTNIIGGLYLGGNYWAKPDGTGFSQGYDYGDLDGICDLPYSINGNNIDYLPLHLTPTGDIEILKEYVNGLEGINNGGENSLNAMLGIAQSQLDMGNERVAVITLNNIIRNVQNVWIDQLSPEQAEYIIGEVEVIIEEIENSEG